jgi:hypothetical protein
VKYQHKGKVLKGKGKAVLASVNKEEATMMYGGVVVQLHHP